KGQYTFRSGVGRHASCAILYTVWPNRELSGRDLDMCRYRRINVAPLVLLLAITSCREAPNPSREQSKAAGQAEPVSAKTAFWEMYKSAYSCAADCASLALLSKQVAGVQN